MAPYRNPFSEVTRRNKLRQYFEPRPNSPPNLMLDDHMKFFPHRQPPGMQSRPFYQEVSAEAGGAPTTPFQNLMASQPDFWNVDAVDEFSQKLDISDPLYRKPTPPDYPTPQDRGRPRPRIGPQSEGPVQFDGSIAFDPPGDEDHLGFRQQVIKVGDNRAVVARGRDGQTELHVGNLPLPFENEEQAKRFVNTFMRQRPKPSMEENVNRELGRATRNLNEEGVKLQTPGNTEVEAGPGRMMFRARKAF